MAYKDPEKDKEYHKRYYQEHKLEISQKNKEFYLANREEYLSKQRLKKRQWKSSHPEEDKERRRNEIIRTRRKFLEMYGNKCAICGETEFQFLTLDHVNNDMIRGENYLCEYYKAIRKYAPDKFQVLCYSCNCNKANQTVKKKEYSTNPVYMHNLENNRRIKDKFFDTYGRKCNCPGCSEIRREYLTLDHVQNDGAIRKKEHHGRGLGEYRRAIREYRPDIYQTLCFNCNCGKERNGGSCPHTNN